MNDGWIEWVWSDKKPHPESLSDMVTVMFSDGDIQEGLDVNFWYDEVNYCNNFYPNGTDGDITHYKLAKGN